MILSALCDYYNRKRDEMPVSGRELKQIGFVLVISKDGKFLRLEDRRKEDRKTADSFLVCKHVGRSSGVVPNFLYDNSSYVLGYSGKDGNDTSELDKKCFEAFQKSIMDGYNKNIDNADFGALSLFYSHSLEENLASVKTDPLWPEVTKSLSKKYATFTFRIEGDTKVVAEKDELIALHTDGDKPNKPIRLCLVSGKKEPCVDITTATMIPGSQAIAKLVSFQVSSGYDSYGHSKCDNAPIGETAEFEYTTALNHMLDKNSRNKFLLANRTFVFWASSSNSTCEQAEKSFFDLINYQAKDDPDRGTENVRKVFQAIYGGSLATTLDDKFYILGLAPNSARIAVVYWQEFAENICKHFSDMEIFDTRKDKKPYWGLFSMIANVTRGGKTSDAAPNLPEALAKSIFAGFPYPDTLYSQCIQRIRAEQQIYVGRAAIIKAYLNRKDKYNNKLGIMLDRQNDNAGYLCGRLFAVLVKIQEDSSNLDSIRERYISAASSTPAAVFSTVLSLSIHHQEKLNHGSQIYYEKLISEIIAGLPADGFPAHLDIQDQGRFFVGYYQQRQDLFTKKGTGEIDNQ